MAKHRHVLKEPITWVLVVTVYFGTAVLVLTRLNVPISTFTVPATASAWQSASSAQRIVADLFAGFLMAPSDSSDSATRSASRHAGATAGALGVVEEIRLRITRLRTSEGELLGHPN